MLAAHAADEVGAHTLVGRTTPPRHNSRRLCGDRRAALCVPLAEVLYVQVGGDDDHSYWGPAELLDDYFVKSDSVAYQRHRWARASYAITAEKQGTDVAAGFAAALAAAAVAFRQDGASAIYGEGYAETLLSHARTLYGFAVSAENVTARRVYSDSVSERRSERRSERKRERARRNAPRMYSALFSRQERHT